MKTINWFLGILFLIFSNFAYAKSESPSVNLGGLQLNHSLTHPVEAILSVKKLPKILNDDYWDISCDYQIVETGGAPDPSASDPFVGIIATYSGDVKGENYTGSGFIAPNGKFQILGFEDEGDVFSTIKFINYDTTGDWVISNCIATLR